MLEAPVSPHGFLSRAPRNNQKLDIFLSAASAIAFLDIRGDRVRAGQLLGNHASEFAFCSERGQVPNDKIEKLERLGVRNKAIKSFLAIIHHSNPINTRPLSLSFSLSLEIDKLVIAGVAEVVVEPDPFLLIEEGFAGESPTLEVEEFLFVAVALEHDVALLADPLDFGESGLEFENPEVVKRGE